MATVLRIDDIRCRSRKVDSWISLNVKSISDHQFVACIRSVITFPPELPAIPLTLEYPPDGLDSVSSPVTHADDQDLVPMTTHYLHDMSPGFARFVLRLFGWRVAGDVPASIRKFVIIAAPHTSWWDFPLGILSRAAIGRKIQFLGKSSLFKPPHGWLMRWLGGYPVDRSKHSNLVEQVVLLFNQKEDFAISLAPEGTRRKVTDFKSGFYYIARGAHVPVICVRMDYGQRIVSFSPPFYPTGDAHEDLRNLWNHFVGVQGKRPGLGITEVH